MKSILVHTHSRSQYILAQKDEINIWSWCNSSVPSFERPIWRRTTRTWDQKSRALTWPINIGNLEYLLMFVMNLINCQDSNFASSSGDWRDASRKTDPWLLNIYLKSIDHTQVVNLSKLISHIKSVLLSLEPFLPLNGTSFPPLNFC